MNHRKNRLEILIERLERIGITITISPSDPWLYLTSVNGSPVFDKYMSNHSFLIALYPTKHDSEPVLSNEKEIFSVIRSILLMKALHDHIRHINSFKPRTPFGLETFKAMYEQEIIPRMELRIAKESPVRKRIMERLVGVIKDELESL